MLDRYKHHINIDGFGINGQKRISNTKVLIVGAGGLGTYVASFLTSMGIGSLGIVDFDNIELSNLNRQIMYSEKDIGKTKVSVLTNKLGNLNSQVQIEGYCNRIEDKCCHELFNEYEIVCDCTDNLHTRLEIDRLCKEHKKPLVYSAVGGWEGYITVLHAKNKVGLSDVLSLNEYAENELSNCSDIGIINTTCSIAGSMQANEVIKLILELDDKLDGYLMCFNTIKNVYRKFKINNTEKSRKHNRVRSR